MTEMIDNKGDDITGINYTDGYTTDGILPTGDHEAETLVPRGEDFADAGAQNPPETKETGKLVP